MLAFTFIALLVEKYGDLCKRLNEAVPDLQIFHELLKQYPSPKFANFKPASHILKSPLWVLIQNGTTEHVRCC